MDSFKGIIISLALIALCSFALISGLYGLQQDNSVNDTIMNDPSIRPFNSSIGENLNSFKTSTNSQLNSTMDEQGTEQQPTGALSLGSIFHVISTFGGFIQDMGLSLFANNGPLRVLGANEIVVGVLFAILIIAAILAFWRIYKWGQ